LYRLTCLFSFHPLLSLSFPSRVSFSRSPTSSSTRLVSFRFLFGWTQATASLVSLFHEIFQCYFCFSRSLRRIVVNLNDRQLRSATRPKFGSREAIAAYQLDAVKTTTRLEDKYFKGSRVVSSSNPSPVVPS